MILFPDDIQAINELLGQRADLDPELLEACQEHIEHRQYADAVFKAFRLLEGRIQHRSGIQGEAAGRLLDQSFATRGPLTQKTGLTGRQAANFRDLLKGAFAVFRNPEAHSGEAIFEYGSAECQVVLAFVNLMLSVLDRKPETPLDAALKQIRRDIGQDAADRLARFLDQVRALDVRVPKRAASFPFRARAWRTTWTEKPKRARTTVFSLYPGSGKPNLHFPIPSQWQPIVGFRPEPYVERLLAVGCVSNQEGHMWLYLREHNSIATFDRLYAIVRDVVHAMEATVTAQQGKGQ